jgi:transcriptional regulator with XRE-family HTH domain
MGTLRKNLGQRLKQLRKAAKLTQEELAAKAGMVYKYLGSVERGERNITLRNLVRLARALDTTAADLTSGIE